MPEDAPLVPLLLSRKPPNTEWKKGSEATLAAERERGSEGGEAGNESAVASPLLPLKEREREREASTRLEGDEQRCFA